MQRFRLDVEFDGTDYVGWQRQINGPSVQMAIENAVFEMLSEKVTVHAAGRTDAGVHALNMTTHLDLNRQIAPERLQSGLNFFLQTKNIAILKVRTVKTDFHARFSATGRRYLYRILNRPAPPALGKGQVWHVAIALNPDLMHQAAQCLVGHHDFSSFRASECQAKSPIKTISSISVTKSSEHINIYLEAPSFLHHQVRNIAGTLKLVGSEKRSIEFVQEALNAKARKAAGPTAPAKGLFFVGANYPEDETGLPS